jgi:hypothetical protein
VTCVRFTVDLGGKNSPEFERATAVMHEISLWMLGEEEGLSETSPAVARVAERQMRSGGEERRWR